MNRRHFIARAGLALGALSGPWLLEACTPAAPSSGSATPSAATGAARAGSVFPTFAPYPNKPKAPQYKSKRRAIRPRGGAATQRQKEHAGSAVVADIGAQVDLGKLRQTRHRGKPWRWIWLISNATTPSQAWLIGV